MNDDTMLPEDDRDRALARRIGARLEKHTPLDDTGEDPSDAAFFQALRDLKHEAEAEGPAADVSDRVWAGLERRMRSRPATLPEHRTVLHRLRPAWPWMAVAASLLALVGLGWLLLFSGPAAPVLLADAETDIVTYTAPDGTVVTLRPRSRLYAVAANKAETRVYLEGEGFFSVAKNEARTFTVEAGDALVHVLGTRFDVSTWGNRTMVYLEEGSVRFEHRPSGRTVVLAPGQQSGVTEDGTLLEPESAVSDEYTDWLRREMTFEQRPLRRIIAELSHHYHVTLDVPANLLDETLSGRILLVDQARSIDDLGVVMGGRFVKVDDNTYRFVAD